MTEECMTSKTGGSLRVFPLMQRVRMAQKDSRAALSLRPAGYALTSRRRRNKGEMAKGG